jgi:hypothetical protein
LRSVSIPTPELALTQMTSFCVTPQPAARSFLRVSRFEDFTLSCFVATTWYGMSLSRRWSNIWTSSLVGPTSPSTNTNTCTKDSRSRRYVTIIFSQPCFTRAGTAA